MRCGGHARPSGDPRPPTDIALQVGKGAGEGYNLNIPWDSEGMGDAEYLHAFEALILPVARAFDPELVLVSAGALRRSRRAPSLGLTPSVLQASTLPEVTPSAAVTSRLRATRT